MRGVLSTAFYVKTRLPIKLLEEITLYKADTDRKPNLSYFHRLEYFGYHHDDHPRRKKFNNQKIKCKSLGYKN